MEEAMVIRKGGTGKRFGLLAVLMAAVSWYLWVLIRFTGPAAWT